MTPYLVSMMNETVLNKTDLPCELSNENELFQLTVLTNKILRNEKQNVDFVTIYDRVYNTILLGNSDELYDRLRMCIAYHLSDDVKKILNGAEGLELLLLMYKTWNNFMEAVRKINDLFIYLDVIMRRRNKNVEGINDMTLTVFQHFLSKTDNLLDRLSNAIIQSVNVDRLGHPCKEAEVCSQILLAVSRGDRDYFKTHFEDKLVVELNRYLRSVMRTSSVVEYVNLVNKLIALETRRALAYGDQKTADLVSNLAKNELINNQVDFIIESETGLWVMMETKRTKIAKKIVRLLMRSDYGPMVMVNAIDRYVNINYKNLPINMDYIIKLIELKKSMGISFFKNSTVGLSIHSHFKWLFNRDFMISIFIALHVDSLLTSNDSNKELDVVINVLEYFESKNKDIFAEHHTYHTATRLLLNKTLNYKREKVILDKLSSKFSMERLKKLRRLFEDLDKSDKLTSDFNCSRNDSVGVGFSIRVLNAFV